MESRNESKINEYPDVIPYASILKIIEQMEKNICKIDSENRQGTGFFCKIPFPDLNNIIPVFITNNHLIDQNILNTKDIKISIYLKGEKDKKFIEYGKDTLYMIQFPKEKLPVSYSILQNIFEKKAVTNII